MDKKYEIQLGTSKNLNAVNVDLNIPLSLSSNQKELLSYDENSIINVAELFNTERQTTEIYRIHGTIDFLSIINGLKKNYSSKNDFFRIPRLGEEISGVTKNVTTCFDVYLCRPATGNTQLSASTFNTKYQILTKINNFEIYKGGYGRNLFFNYNYIFNFNIDFDVTNYYDSFGKPLTNLYLFFNFKPTTNGNGVIETVFKKSFNSNSTSTINLTTGLTYQTYTLGNVIDGDLVTYIPENFEETIINRQEYYVRFQYNDSGSKLLEFKYNPLIPIKLREFTEEIIKANVSGTTESDQNIPYYAKKIDNYGNYVWKDFLIKGYIDPINGLGIDYPFVNKRHYVFNNITLPLIPNMDHTNTESVFNNIKFGPNEVISVKPNTNLNSLGNKCAS